MALVEEFQRQGNWLFRWRSYLPFAIVGLVAVALTQFHWPFGSYSFHELWEEICLGISCLGLLVRAIAVGYAPAGTSGRNTKAQVADELNTTGLYSVCRHPLYLGNYLIGLGIASVLTVWWLPVIYSLAFWLYYERIMMAEEAYLCGKFGERFTSWAVVTPAFWPRLSGWRRPSLPFSFRNVLRREYTGLIVVILPHALIEVAEHALLEHRLVWEWFWASLVVLSVIAYFTLRALKKNTTLLDIEGRC